MYPVIDTIGVATDSQYEETQLALPLFGATNVVIFFNPGCKPIVGRQFGVAALDIRHAESFKTIPTSRFQKKVKTLMDFTFRHITAT
jgi:hypothetical protein